MPFKPGNRAAAKRKPKPAVDEPVQSEPVEVAVTATPPEVKPVVAEQPKEVAQVSNPQYDIAIFIYTAIESKKIGTPFSKDFDPTSAKLWSDYISGGWRPMSFQLHPRHNQIVVMFEKA